jgi:hypothetical protein
MQWTLEGVGFPAVSSDAQQVALAFGELQTAGPPILVLTVEVRAIDSGAVVRTSTFREPYAGELGAAYVTPLRKRITDWAAGENRALGAAAWITLPKSEPAREWVCTDSPVQTIAAGPLEVTLLDRRRLVVRASPKSAPFIDRPVPQWTPTTDGPPFPCSYPPGLSGAFYDPGRRVLVVEADHCSLSDMCRNGVPPSFAVVRTP